MPRSQMVTQHFSCLCARERAHARVRACVHACQQQRESDRQELCELHHQFPVVSSAEGPEQLGRLETTDLRRSRGRRRRWTFFFPPPSRRSDEESLQETTQERTSGPSRERNEGVVWCSSSLHLPQTFEADSFIPRLSFCVSLLPSILGNCNAVCLCRTASIVMLKTAVEEKKRTI